MRARLGSVYHLGFVEYTDGLLLMDHLVPKRIEGAIPDSLFLLNHPHTITSGRRAKQHNILLTQAQAKAKGVGLFETGRGGDVTYHGPGQIVGYPIISLRPGRMDAHKYVRDLEEVLIRTLKDYGIVAGRVPGLTGVWVGNEKIAAIGIRLKRWVTSHGFALNVNTDLDAFSTWIVPCGLENKGLTSIKKLLGKNIPLAEVESRIVGHFQAVFDTTLENKTKKIKPSVQVIALRRRPQGWQALCLKRTPQKGGFWQPVTGHIEAGESPKATALRELKEETGLQGTMRSLNYVHTVMIDPKINPDLPVPTIYGEHSFMAEVSGDVMIDPNSHEEAIWLDLPQAQAQMRWFGNQHAIELAKNLI